ncbi:hypothetical protein CBR_g9047 [Chara braunii]|uniref:Uncharacterized protein n=1 Tax=Chara braunii TaxID=69332 RepID=A0A388KNK7_CHABU|nr:hypothetical protein CBR_g9047 [Chara braunii]|eukprot:GBG71631.1 hypothetical protein CBR_g9047 [Chara braunii]
MYSRQTFPNFSIRNVGILYCRGAPVLPSLAGGCCRCLISVFKVSNCSLMVAGAAKVLMLPSIASTWSSRCSNWRFEAELLGLPASGLGAACSKSCTQVLYTGMVPQCCLLQVLYTGMVPHSLSEILQFLVLFLKLGLQLVTGVNQPGHKLGEELFVLLFRCRVVVALGWFKVPKLEPVDAGGFVPLQQISGLLAAGLGIGISCGLKQLLPLLQPVGGQPRLPLGAVPQPRSVRADLGPTCGNRQWTRQQVGPTCPKL